MLYEITAFVLTIVLGPVMFFVIGSFLAKKNAKKKLNKYPTGINDLVGDMLFLPLFNSMLVYFGIIDAKFNLTIYLSSIIFAFFVLIIYIIYDLNYTTYIDWSKPRKGKYNLGGYYHLTFIFGETIIISYGLIILYGVINIYSYFLLWVPLLGYFLSAFLQFYKHNHL